jgi:DNA-binding MarR family transcriptional regulator
MSRTGADLALLLLGGYRTLVDAAMEELSGRGYDDFRPVHDFAMRSIGAGADSASDVGRRMSVSKQAAAKTIKVLMDRGYVVRDEDPHDARRKRLRVTPLGFEVLRQGEAIFDELRERWEKQIGVSELATLEARLTSLVGDGAIRPDAPGWISEDPG